MKAYPPDRIIVDGYTSGKRHGSSFIKFVEVKATIHIGRGLAGYDPATETTTLLDPEGLLSVVGADGSVKVAEPVKVTELAEGVYEVASDAQVPVVVEQKGTGNLADAYHADSDIKFDGVYTVYYDEQGTVS
jgi:hypothetical protein